MPARARGLGGGRAGGHREHRIGASIDDKCGAADPGMAPERPVAEAQQGPSRHAPQASALPPQGAREQPAPAAAAVTGPGAPAPARAIGARARPLGRRERPPAPWHPLPLSELLIFIGAIGAAIGLAERNHRPLRAARRGPRRGGDRHGRGHLREHLSGFRSHTVMLARDPADRCCTRRCVLGLAGVHPRAALGEPPAARHRRRAVRVPVQMPARAATWTPAANGVFAGRRWAAQAG